VVKCNVTQNPKLTAAFKIQSVPFTIVVMPIVHLEEVLLSVTSAKIRSIGEKPDLGKEGELLLPSPQHHEVKCFTGIGRLCLRCTGASAPLPYIT
jgi:hypothetical protein